MGIASALRVATHAASMSSSDQFGPPVQVSRLDAALRQLDTALTLWFLNGDPISTHTLACAAHQLLHDMNRDAKGPELLFDSSLIDESARKQVIAILKAEMNYFKHGDGRRSKGNRVAPSIQLHAESTFLFLVAAGSAALRLSGAPPTDGQAAFIIWLQLHRPNLIEPDQVDKFKNSIPVEKIAYLRSLRRPDLYKIVIERQAYLRTAGLIV
jgi:hypothetical protein